MGSRFIKTKIRDKSNSKEKLFIVPSKRYYFDVPLVCYTLSFIVLFDRFTLIETFILMLVSIMFFFLSHTLIKLDNNMLLSGKSVEDYYNVKKSYNKMKIFHLLGKIALLLFFISSLLPLFVN